MRAEGPLKQWDQTPFDLTHKINKSIESGVPPLFLLAPGEVTAVHAEPEGIVAIGVYAPVPCDKQGSGPGFHQYKPKLDSKESDSIDPCIDRKKKQLLL